MLGDWSLTTSTDFEVLRSWGRSESWFIDNGLLDFVVPSSGDRKHGCSAVLVSSFEETISPDPS